MSRVLERLRLREKRNSGGLDTESQSSEKPRSNAMGKILRAFGGAIPKGIKHPDSLVSNSHLYIPGRRGRTRLR